MAMSSFHSKRVFEWEPNPTCKTSYLLLAPAHYTLRVSDYTRSIFYFLSDVTLKIP